MPTSSLFPFNPDVITGATLLAPLAGVAIILILIAVHRLRAGRTR